MHLPFFYNLEGIMFTMCFLHIPDFQSILLFPHLLLSVWGCPTLGGSHTPWTPFKYHLPMSKWVQTMLKPSSSTPFFCSVDQFVWWQDNECMFLLLDFVFDAFSRWVSALFLWVRVSSILFCIYIHGFPCYGTHLVDKFMARSANLLQRAR